MALTLEPELHPAPRADEDLALLVRAIHQAGIVVADAPRSADSRAALRAALAGARLAELREGVWARPDNLGDLPAAVPSATADALQWFRTTPDGDPVALAARLWPLADWSARAGELVARMAGLVGPLEAGEPDVLADGFVLSADVLRHVQADPLLPPALLPPDWPGPHLRTTYDRYDAAYRTTLGTWLTSTD